MNREDAHQAVCEALVVDDLQRMQAPVPVEQSGRLCSARDREFGDRPYSDDHPAPSPARSRAALAGTGSSGVSFALLGATFGRSAALIGRLPRGDGAADSAEVAAAVARVRRAVPMGYQAERSAATQMVDISTAEQAGPAAGAEDLAAATPEDQLMERQERLLLEKALAALQAALPRLTATERLYLECALAGHPAREIARMNGLPVEAVHRLAQQVKRRLAQEIGGVEAVKNWKLSV